MAFPGDEIEDAALRLLNGAQSPDDARLCLAHFLNYWRDDKVNTLVAEWIGYYRRRRRVRYNTGIKV